MRTLSVAGLLLAIACARGEKPAEGTEASVSSPADVAPVTALAYWPGHAASEVGLYAAPIPVATSVREAEIPRIILPPRGGKSNGAARNKAVEIEVFANLDQPKIFGSHAPNGRTFVVVDTRWRNVHPKQRVSKNASAADRTMGVGSLGVGSSGGGGGSARDSIDADVAYQVPRLADHVYLVADGMATSLHSATEEIPGGPKIGTAFTIKKLGETRDARLAFIAPAGAKNVAIQFLDYEYGHVLVPIRGDSKKAAGDGKPPGNVLDKAQLTKLDIAAHSIAFNPDFAGVAAPQGWRFAVVQLGGRSRSVTGKLGDIVQVDPLKFIWLEGDGGYVYPAAAGSTNAGGVLRFTPEIYQTQDVAFLVPAGADRFRLGLRADKEVARLGVTDKKPGGIPGAKQTHKDGNTMEILLLGSRQEGQQLILDLAIKPLDTKGQGIDITADQQFLLVTPGGEVRPDMTASWNLINRPPRPFVVQPGTPVRFELAFPGGGTPTALRVRGFESEGRLKL